MTVHKATQKTWSAVHTFCEGPVSGRQHGLFKGISHQLSVIQSHQWVTSGHHSMCFDWDLGYRHHFLSFPVIKHLKYQSIHMLFNMHLTNLNNCKVCFIDLTPQMMKRIYLRPATPRTTRLSLVSVPVLSKQQTSTLPANGILKGSVQNTSGREKINQNQVNQCGTRKK